MFKLALKTKLLHAFKMTEMTPLSVMLILTLPTPGHHNDFFFNIIIDTVQNYCNFLEI